MSQRKYIIVNGERVYDWSIDQIEFTCDGCNEVILPEQPQIHLYVNRGYVAGCQRDAPDYRLVRYRTP